MPAERAMTTMSNRFSPEIALVDPDLASKLRRSLPDPGDCLARPGKVAATLPPESAMRPMAEHRPGAPIRFHERSSAEVPGVPLSVTAAHRTPFQSSRHPAREAATWSSRSRRRLIGRLAVWVVALALLAIPFLAFLSPDSSSILTRVARGADARERESARNADEAATDGDRVLEWRAVPDASLYNIVFVSGKIRVDRWVKSTSLTLPRAGATAEAEAPVIYRWYVYPVFRNQQNVEFGKVLAQGAIHLPKGSFER